ncbi:hypothetical protein [Alienimonas chondri]|uniref:Uncharacterized protein n=1 Tax=Alienimonas chondri TaxID=2681879 RepID=A0ABX1V9L6_9PLAN|nr:hypothetical protein [Alienimonas chondri]NNJ23987.1 hypothetical protein [Alienimonas chondri]
MFIPTLPPPAPNVHITAADWDHARSTEEREGWSAERLMALPVPEDSLQSCREALVRSCRDCPDFQAAVSSLMEAGPSEIAAMAGLLHEERFGLMLQELAATARTCGMGQAGELQMIPRTVEVSENPLRPVVKRLSKQAKLRDSGGVTLPLIVGRSLVEWSQICTGTA